LNQKTSSSSVKSAPVKGVNNVTFPLKTPHDYVFTRWMGSWERRLSLWSNQTYSDALLSYIGKIYGQQANVYHFFNRLWNESLHQSMDELDLLHVLIDKLGKIPGAKSSLMKRQEISRIESRLNELKTILDPNVFSRFQISSRFSRDQLIDRSTIHSYLDLGCGNGLITGRLGEYLQLSSDRIYGADVFNSDNPELTFASIDANPSKIHLADQSVDLITCLVTLHHIPNLDSMLIELARVITPNGYLIIREHDCKLERSLITKYLNYIHAIMIIARIGEFSMDCTLNLNENVSWSEEKKKIIQYTRAIQYQTRDEWKKKLESIGFELLATYDYDSKKSNNPQRLFYALYKRRQSAVIDPLVK